VKKILIVDDDKSIRRLIERQLAAEGFDVASCGNADDAIEWFSSNGVPDLLVTDVKMPGLSGPELYEHLKTSYDHFPVLFISGYTGDTSVQTINPLLDKPFSRADLIAAVNDAL